MSKGIPCIFFLKTCFGNFLKPFLLFMAASNQEGITVRCVHESKMDGLYFFSVPKLIPVCFLFIKLSSVSRIE